MPMIRLHEGNITELGVDAIVNAANTQLQHGGGVAAAIVRAGGRVIQEESNRIGWCDLGKAAATGAGSLKARHVIHVPTIDYRSGRRASLGDIEAGTRAALVLARELGARSIAFPLLGAGIVGLPRRQVAEAMLRALRDAGDLEVVVCAYARADKEALEGLV
jgi:O-acetyl-ADP-ribose deacetylase (regulator of RNase III)